jgi:hypothetical protein
MASAESKPSKSGDSAIVLVGIDRYVAELPAAEAWVKYEPVLDWPDEELLQTRLTQEILPGGEIELLADLPRVREGEDETR